MGREIGIDLGTCYSAVAMIKDGKIVVAENKEGNLLTPSVVYFSEDGQIVVGERAQSFLIASPSHCVWEVKRLMGEDVTAYIHPDTGKKYSPVEISSFILKELKESAEQFFGEEVDSAVVSVPAYFGNAARQATGEAANMAGLKVRKIVNEPSMAVRAYIFNHGRMRGIYAVLDLGGGTMDMSVAEVDETECKILTSDGDRRLGGTDFTMALEKLGLEEFGKGKVSFDPADPSDAACLQDVREKAERAKRELSKLNKTSIHVMAKGAQVALDITRDQFEQLTREYVDRIKDKCLSAIGKGAGDVSKLAGIIVTGGATRMHSIQQMVEELSGGVPVLKDVPVDLAVCQGCAIEAYELSGKSTHVLPIKKMLDVSSFDIGVAAHKLSDADPNRMFVGCIIPKGTPLPVSKSRRFGVASMPGSSGLAAELIICEGTEDQEYKDAMKVQSFTLTGIAPGSDPEKPRIEVTISVDASGIVTAEAMDIETGQKICQEITRRAIQ